MSNILMINFYTMENNLIEAIICPHELAKIGDTFVTSGPEREQYRVVSISSDSFEQNCVCERIN